MLPLSRVLEVQSLLVGPVEGDPVATTVFFDNGATISLCTHDWAAKANVEGTPTTLYLRVIGEQYQRVKIQVYPVSLTDNNGNVHTVIAHGMDVITEVQMTPDLQPIKQLFPGVPDVVFERPTGPVDLLIGQNYRKLQPKGGVDRGNLRMVQSLFGAGEILTGSDARLGPGGQKMTQAAVRMAEGVVELPAGGSVFHVE